MALRMGIGGLQIGRPPRRQAVKKAKGRLTLREAQDAAKLKFPKLNSRLEKITIGINQARLSGRRFAYKDQLLSLYKMAWKKDQDGELNEFVQRVAALRAMAIPANANSCSVLVRAILPVDTDRRTVSRWSTAMMKALNKRIEPDDFREHI